METMKPRATLWASAYSKAVCLAASALLMGGICFATNSFGADAEVIDAKANAAMKRFYKQVKGAHEFASRAKGLLIMPDVVKAAFIVGGEYGEGALRIDGKTVDYYNIVSGSLGFQIGAEAKDIVIAFMTPEALQDFRASMGWEAGLDGNVALITVGAGERVDTRTITDPIVGFVFDVKGLMADISLQGAKFSKLDKSAKNE
jgi:lipid-binding SYLF domain-containing protein